MKWTSWEWSFIMRESSLFVWRRFLYFSWKLTGNNQFGLDVSTVFLPLMWIFGIVRMAMVEWKSLCMKETCAFVNCHVLFVFFSSPSHLFAHQEKKPQRTKIIPLPWKLTSISPQKIGWVWNYFPFLFKRPIFRCHGYVSFREAIWKGSHNPTYGTYWHTVDGGNPAPPEMYETL